ncbi:MULTISPECIES: hypothetical protein [unclassified Microbacterium]|uniref:hypothetical protein n=1 Tax=unclassified Microbacterium TaxID=2609290 RepID=UPI000EA95CF8|nr:MULTISPECIES: hypothetical protein [unclassified Microbacterium]MBT2485832.1 hypothetical protein [Microbacterium sp. ISL-108]RKN68593.1 hypothetical protein D7252_14035 [Microbacterium sp. CGR2]
MNTREEIVTATAKAIRAEIERQYEDRHDGPFTLPDDSDDSLLIDGVVNLLEIAESALVAIEASGDHG